ncbi:MAG: hypothetical protein Q9204_004059 [Flavoplaca sp. TL-2023a]
MLIVGHYAKSSFVRLARLAGYSIRIPLQWSTSPSLNSHRHLIPFSRHSTVPLAQETPPWTSVDTDLSDTPAPWNQSASTGQQESAVSAIEPTIRQVNTTRIGKKKNPRSQAEKLDIYKKGKAFRNRMLKDRGSWSYDWRIPLQDLLKYHVTNENGDAAPTAFADATRKVKVPHNLRADHINTPSTWTKSTFYTYVVQLTASSVDRLVARQIYSKTESHMVIVAEILARLFADPSLKYFVSIAAGNVALRFLFDNGRFARGQDLFGQLQELQKDSDPSTYNIMLGAAAEQQDLHTFTYILKMMVIYKVSPNTQTWLHLARAVREDDVRTIIINRMGERGMLADAAARKEAVAILMPQLVVKYLDSGNNAHELIEVLDNRYGSAWCSSSAAELLIDEIGVRHSTEEAMIILRKLCDRGYRPSQGMLLLLLRQCSWSNAHELAVQLLCHFRTEYRIKPSMQIYDLLFQRAWKSQLHNCCRVLWLHACIQGCTSFDMQRVVKRSLYVQRRTAFSEQSRSSIWEETAGKIIAGHGRENNFTRFRTLMSLWKPAGADRRLRDEFLRKVRSILDDDLTAVGRYSIREPLDEQLCKALRMDRRWASSHVLKEVPMDCKYSQLIDVQLTPSPNTKSTIDLYNGRIRPVDASTECAGYCWMREEVRSRHCVCPEEIKREPDAIQDVDSCKQKVTAKAMTTPCI